MATSKKTSATTKGKKSSADKTKKATTSTAKKTTARKSTTTVSKKTTSNSVKLTAAEKTLLSLYRAADAETKKAAIALLKGEKSQLSGILQSILENKTIMNTVTSLFK